MKRLLLPATLLLACVPAAAWAKATCTVSATGIAFGASISPFGTTLTPTGTVKVVCTKGSTSTTFKIAASTGNGTFAQRYMVDGSSNHLNYNLYTDTNHTVTWGDGVTGGTAVINGVNEAATTTYTVYGQLPLPQTLGAASYPDAYSDTITMTITY